MMRQSINALIATLFTVGLLQCLQFGIPKINFDFLVRAKVVNDVEVPFYYKTSLNKVLRMETIIVLPPPQVTTQDKEEIRPHLKAPFTITMLVACRRKRYHAGKRFLLMRETLRHHYTSLYVLKLNV